MIDVCWIDYREGESGRGIWDQGILEHIFAGTLAPIAKQHSITHHHDFDWVQEGDGAVVVFKSGNNADKLDTLNSHLRALDWVVLIMPGDEESLIDLKDIRHPNIIFWVALPRPDKHRRAPKGTRFIGCGFPPDAPGLLHMLPDDRPFDWTYAGQVNHSRREECVTVAKTLENKGFLHETAGFTQGLARDEYYEYLAGAKVVLCPSGPTTPDSFRVWEALEAGCVPLVDAKTPDDLVPGYWEFLVGDVLPTIDDWNDLPGILAGLINDWPNNANLIADWWFRYKRDMARWLVDDIRTLGGPDPDVINFDTTVLVTASPTPDHPDIDMIENTIASIREQLPTAEILIMFDGVRKELEHRREAYVEHKRRILDMCRREWTNVTPMIFTKHTQQAGMTKVALRMIDTPYLVFMEHDTPICGEIDWHGMKQAIASGEADIIRLYQNTDLEPAHAHMIFDTIDICGVPVTRTSQFSSRPHISSVPFYKEMMRAHFDDDDIAFIELRMHSVCASEYFEHGLLGWYRHRLWIYTPEGNIQRSLHTNGRGDDPAFADA